MSLETEIPAFIRKEPEINSRLHGCLKIYKLDATDLGTKHDYTFVFVSWEDYRNVFKEKNDPSKDGKSLGYIFQGETLVIYTYHEFKQMRPWNEVDFQKLSGLLYRYSAIREEIDKQEAVLSGSSDDILHDESSDLADAILGLLIVDYKHAW